MLLCENIGRTVRYMYWSGFHAGRRFIFTGNSSMIQRERGKKCKEREEEGEERAKGRFPLLFFFKKKKKAGL
jgi:hypothetical protein